MTFRSVETPVAKRPRDATAREPPRSTAKSQRELDVQRLVEAHTHASNRAAMKDV